jgi:hypothetical protein
MHGDAAVQKQPGAVLQMLADRLNQLVMVLARPLEQLL